MSVTGHVQNGVVVLDTPDVFPDGTAVKVEAIETLPEPPQMQEKRPRTSLAEWADANAEHWGNGLSSEDVEGFTGRRI